jgi:hypothetical protein
MVKNNNTKIIEDLHIMCKNVAILPQNSDPDRKLCNNAESEYGPT